MSRERFSAACHSMQFLPAVIKLMLEGHSQRYGAAASPALAASVRCACATSCSLRRSPSPTGSAASAALRTAGGRSHRRAPAAVRLLLAAASTVGEPEAEGPSRASQLPPSPGRVAPAVAAEAMPGRKTDGPPPCSSQAAGTGAGGLPAAASCCLALASTRALTAIASACSLSCRAQQTAAHSPLAAAPPTDFVPPLPSPVGLNLLR